MKKIIVLVLLSGVFIAKSNAQLMVSKLIGKDFQKYGLGYGVFTYFDFPLANENQSLRVELMDLVMYPSKGENFFTTTADGEAYLSMKLGYKYVFSETQTGFYLEPSAGYCRVINLREGRDAVYKDGLAAALEGGYSLEVGSKGHTINFGLKYETDRAGQGYILNNIGFRVSYAFNLFRKKDD